MSKYKPVAHSTRVSVLQMSLCRLCLLYQTHYYGALNRDLSETCLCTWERWQGSRYQSQPHKRGAHWLLMRDGHQQTGATLTSQAQINKALLLNGAPVLKHRRLLSVWVVVSKIACALGWNNTSDCVKTEGRVMICLPSNIYRSVGPLY